MVVMILERVPVSLRGELTRWMLEPKAGVFIGSVSAMVRQRLWEKACSKAGGGACMMFWSANTEQGFRVDFWGGTKRHVTNWDGLVLMTEPNVPEKAAPASPEIVNS